MVRRVSSGGRVRFAKRRLGSLLSLNSFLPMGRWRQPPSAVWDSPLNPKVRLFTVSHFRGSVHNAEFLSAFIRVSALIGGSFCFFRGTGSAHPPFWAQFSTTLPRAIEFADMPFHLPVKPVTINFIFPS